MTKENRHTWEQGFAGGKCTKCGVRSYDRNRGQKCPGTLIKKPRKVLVKNYNVTDFRGHIFSSGVHKDGWQVCTMNDHTDSEVELSDEELLGLRDWINGLGIPE